LHVVYLVCFVGLSTTDAIYQLTRSFYSQVPDFNCVGEHEEKPVFGLNFKLEHNTSAMSLIFFDLMRILSQQLALSLSFLMIVE